MDENNRDLIKIPLLFRNLVWNYDSGSNPADFRWFYSLGKIHFVYSLRLEISLNLEE